VPLAGRHFDAGDARIAARIAGLEGYSHGQRWTFAPMVDHPVDPRWGRVGRPR
jgi:beta-glucosidase-like glycosyl hydrolase